jgi:hypothetical protein
VLEHSSLIFCAVPCPVPPLDAGYCALLPKRVHDETQDPYRISSKTMCLGIDILKPKKEVVYI